MPRTIMPPAIPPKTSAYIDARGDGSYGYIQFDDEIAPNFAGQEVRLGYIAGKATADEKDESAHPTARHSPYVFIGNWGEPTFGQILIAWMVAVERIPGFDHVDPNTVRWMNGGEFVTTPTEVMELLAERERKSSLAVARSARRP